MTTMWIAGLRAAATLTLVGVICACGGGDDGFEWTVTQDPNQGGDGWVSIDESSVPTGSTGSTSVFLQGTAFRTDSFVCCSGSAVSDTGVSVAWTNTTTGLSGPATQEFAVDYVGFFYFLQHTWSARIPLAAGDNVIQLRASDNAGNFGIATATVTRFSSTASAPSGGTTPAPDPGTAVRIASMDPVPNATGVPFNQATTIVFDAPVNGATVTSATVMLQDASGNSVEATVAYATLIATLDPVHDLAPQSSYQVLVTNGVLDLAGNALATTYSWIFTTGAAPDVVPPEVVSTTPPDGVQCAVADAGITAAFSEPIDHESMTGAAFTVVDAHGNPVPGSVSGLSATRYAFAPSNALPAATTYAARISTDVTDTSGNRLASERRWSFEVPEGIGAWQGVSPDGATSSLYGHSAVWTGKEVILWGGVVAQSSAVHQATASGARYDPASDSWAPVSSVGAPTARSGHAAVWTGREMIVWGAGAQGFADGARYDPEADVWRPVSAVNAPRGAALTAIWTGTEMLLWSPLVSTGPRGIGRYDPESDSWRPMSTTNEPPGLAGYSAVWTGSKMLVLGLDQTTHVTIGGSYDPVADAWESMDMQDAPSPRFDATEVWTGTEMAVWGGRTGSLTLQTGALYNPVTKTWRAMSSTCAPSGRAAHTAVWTGSEMLVWGGMSFGNGDRFYLRSGARYDPVSDTWRVVRYAGAPSERQGHVAAWTGTHLFLWGGVGGSGDLATGGRYQP